jgi:hypothetical protein
VARHRAVDRGLSLAAYLAELTAKADIRERTAREARKRLKLDPERGLDLGAAGGITWTQESLHER